MFRSPSCDKFNLLVVLCISSCTNGSRHVPPPSELAIVESLRIDGHGANPLTDIAPRQLAVGPTGTIYVGQLQQGEVRLYGSDGTLQRTIGGIGRGPGEFLRIFSLGTVSDTLYVIDIGLRRISYYSLDGDFYSSVQLRPHVTPPYVALPPFLLIPGGGVSAPGIDPSRQLSRVPYLITDRTGSPKDTLAWASTEGAMIRVPTMADGVLTLPHPFPRSDILSVSRDLKYVAVIIRDTEAPRYNLILMQNRDTVLVRSYTYAPLTIHGREIDSAVARLNLANRSHAERDLRHLLARSRTRPPVNSALFDQSGRLWLERERVPGERRMWELLDSTGTPVARLRLPPHCDLRVVTDTDLYCVEADILDVPSIARYSFDSIPDA